MAAAQRKKIDREAKRKKAASEGADEGGGRGRTGGESQDEGQGEGQGKGKGRGEGESHEPSEDMSFMRETMAIPDNETSVSAASMTEDLKRKTFFEKARLAEMNKNEGDCEDEE